MLKRFEEVFLEQTLTLLNTNLVLHSTLWVVLSHDTGLSNCFVLLTNDTFQWHNACFSSTVSRGGCFCHIQKEKAAKIAQHIFFDQKNSNRYAPKETKFLDLAPEWPCWICALCCIYLYSCLVMTDQNVYLTMLRVSIIWRQIPLAFNSLWPSGK